MDALLRSQVRTLVRQNGSLKDHHVPPGASSADVVAIVAAAVADGRGARVIFPAGVTNCGSLLNLDNAVDITFCGVDSAPGFFATAGSTTPGCELRFTGTGSGSFISAKDSNGFTIENLSIRYSNTGFTGTLLDIGATTLRGFGFTARGCYFAGISTAMNATLANLNGAVEYLFDNVNFENSAVGIFGQGGGFSNAITFRDCHFAGLTTTVQSPYAQWTFESCIFESSTMDQVGPVSPIKSTSGAFGVQGLTFIGCGWWDANGGGPWIDVFGAGVTIVGGYWEPQGSTSESLVQVRTNSTHTNFDGLTITGLRAEGMNTSTGSPLVQWSQTDPSHTFTNVNLSGNSLKNAIDGIDAITGLMSLAPASAAASLKDHGNVTTAITMTRAAAQKATLTGATAAIAVPAVGTGVRTSIELTLTQDGTGSRVVTWPANVVWAGGSAPTLTTTAGHSDVLRLWTDDGTVWSARVVAANLAAYGVPGAPVSLAAVAGANSVDLSWTAPNNGGSAITDYTVQWRTTTGPGSWTTFTHSVSAATAITVTGLTNGTSYDFHVAAVNAAGTGAYCSPVSATPVVSPTFNPLTAFTWDAAFWASDPSWTPPANGAGVASWRDGSGHSRTLTQGTAGKQPTFRSAVTNLNAKPGVEFDGVNDDLFSPSFSQAQTFSVVLCVADTTPNAGSGRLLSGADNAVQIWATSAGFEQYAGAGPVVWVQEAQAGHLLICVFNGASSQLLDNANPHTTGDAGTGTIAGGISVGARGDDSLFGALKAGFVGVYAGDIRSDTNYADLRAWAASFYGITVV